jgi:hypothetical protein
VMADFRALKPCRGVQHALHDSDLIPRVRGRLCIE